MKNNEVSNLPCVEKYFHFGEIESTSDVAKDLKNFPKEGIVVVHADRQTAGRGQRGNSFFSGDGGLYATVVCPLPEIELHFVLNRAMSLAVCEAVQGVAGAAPLAIKWPNDILWAGKKICGILLESVRTGEHIAVGVGINVNTTSDEFPAEIRSLATSMAIETGKRFDVGALLTDMCMRFQRHRMEPGRAAHDRYRERLFGIGERIRIGGQIGIFETVREDGRLCLKVENHMELLSTGSIQFVEGDRFARRDIP
jgi:BirA family biotin operon repressor/biotin-[acetyl-CoA-carboxylase] ligase